MSFVQQVADAVGTAPLRALDDLSRSIWAGLAAGALNDDDAQALAELIHARRLSARAPERSVQRRVGSRPRSPASMERRRSWAASGRLPPHLAARFTLAEVAVLALVAVQVAKHGACTLTIGHLAAVAGVSPSTVRNATRQAQALGLLRVEERRLTAWRNAPNRITITSPEWLSWLRLGSKGGGYKSVQPTPTRAKKPDASSLKEAVLGCQKAAGRVERRSPASGPLKGGRRP